MVRFSRLVIAIESLAHDQYVIAAPERVFVYGLGVQEHVGVVAGRLTGRATVKIPDGQVGRLRRNEVDGAVLAADVLASAIDPDVSGLDLTGNREVEVLGDDGFVEGGVGRADEVVSSGSSGARAGVAHGGARRADASMLEWWPMAISASGWVGGWEACDAPGALFDTGWCVFCVGARGACASETAA